MILNLNELQWHCGDVTQFWREVIDNFELKLFVLLPFSADSVYHRLIVWSYFVYIPCAV
jgi:hypothetical protein